MTAALYARVSTARQAETDLSLPDQLKQMRDYCKRQGWSVAMEYVEDGASATSDRRPVFQQMMNDATATNPPPFRVLVVHSLSRFFRDSLEFAMYERKLKKAGVRLESVTQAMSDDPSGEMVRKIISVFDEYQSKEGGKHTLRAMQENARQGHWNGATAPFGYRTINTDAKGRGGFKKRIEIHPSEAAIVRRIYAMYNGDEGPESHGFKSIAARLNERGLTRRGDRWSKTMIATILEDERYIGEWYFNKRVFKTREIKPRSEWIKLDIPGLVSEAEYALAAQRRVLRRPDVAPGRRLSSPTLLTGFAFCGECGAGYTIATGKGGRYRYYKCHSRIAKHKNCCSNKSVGMEKLNQAVLQGLADKVLDRERLTKLLEKLQGQFSKQRQVQEQQLKAFKTELSDNQASTHRLLEAVEKGRIPLDSELEARSHKLQARRQELLVQIAGLQGRAELPVKAIHPKQVEAFSEAMRARLNDGKSLLGKRLLEALQVRVVVNGHQVQVSGPTAALGGAYSDHRPGQPIMVPSRGLGWCARLESNQ